MADDVQHRGAHVRVVEVEVWLVRVEPMPEVGAGGLVPRPVRILGIEEDDPRLGVEIRRVTPHVPVSILRTGLAGSSEPLVGVGRVVHHQVGDDPQIAGVCLIDQLAEIVDRAEFGLDRVEVTDVVAGVA